MSLRFPYGEKLPEGARPWTREELVENARRVAQILKPEEYALGESRMPEGSRNVLLAIVVPQEPRLHAGPEIQIAMDPRTGMPTNVWTYPTVLPPIVPERLAGLQSEEALAAEGLRVHRSLPVLGGARISESHYTYSVPDCSGMVHEMTPEHRAFAATRSAIPMYRFRLVRATPGKVWERLVWIDARTGRAVGARTSERARNESIASVASPADAPESGRWRLGGVEGALSRIEFASFHGAPTVLTNDRGETLTLLFDSRTGLVRDGTSVYRPDAALLRALRDEGSAQPFGGG